MGIDRQLNYGRDQIKKFAYSVLKEKKEAAVLDIGARHGTDLLNIRKRI